MSKVAAEHGRGEASAQASLPALLLFNSRSDYLVQGIHLRKGISCYFCVFPQTQKAYTGEQMSSSFHY